MNERFCDLQELTVSGERKVSDLKLTFVERSKSHLLIIFISCKLGVSIQFCPEFVLITGDKSKL